NPKDSNSWGQSLQPIPNVARNFRGPAGFAPADFAHCTLHARAQPARASVCQSFPSGHFPILPAGGLVPPVRVFVFRFAPAGASAAAIAPALFAPANPGARQKLLRRRSARASVQPVELFLP